MAAMVREAWTDERLDDLQAGMQREFGHVRTEMNRGFERVDTDLRELRSEMNARFDSVNARFDALNRTLILGFVSIVATLIGAVLAQGLL